MALKGQGLSWGGIDLDYPLPVRRNASLLQTLVTQHQTAGRACSPDGQPQGITADGGGGLIRRSFGGNQAQAQNQGMAGTVGGIPGDTPGKEGEGGKED